MRREDSITLIRWVFDLIWILRSANSEATDFYLETVAIALERAGFAATAVPAEKARACVMAHAKSGDWFISANVMEACRIFSWGARNIILWCQGIIPEESFLRNGSKVKASALSLIEKRALKKAAFCLFVSDDMRRHYERKYKLDFDGRCFVMPCFNSTLQTESFFVEGKYDSPTFAYVGSLAAWQCFEATIDLYKELEGQLCEARLKVLTFDQDMAREVLKAKGVKHYELGCVPPEKVAQELAGVAYGFVIREDDPVNRVATPTKLSSYMAAGVIPVFSECIGSFSELAHGLSYAIPVGCPVDVDEVAQRCAVPPRREAVLAEYRQIFDTYYSREYYVERLAPLLASVIGEGGRA